MVEYCIGFHQMQKLASFHGRDIILKQRNPQTWESPCLRIWFYKCEPGSMLQILRKNKGNNKTKVTWADLHFDLFWSLYKSIWSKFELFGPYLIYLKPFRAIWSY